MERYQELFNDMLAASGLEASAEVERDIDVTIGDVAISLSFEAISGEEQVALSARIGKVPKAREIDIYRLLLEANVNWSATRFATLGVNSATLDAIICYRRAMDGMTGGGLANLLSSFAEVAAQWREIIADEAAVEADGAVLRDGVDMLTALRV